MRFKLWLGVLLTGITVLILLIWGRPLIQMYLNGSYDGGDTAATLMHGQEYLLIMLVGLPPFMLVQVYASTLRACGCTILPMKAGITAVLVNLVFNYLLIYGKFGFPQMGVAGAAIATVLSRYVEAVIVVGWTHKHKEVNTYIKGLYRTMKIPGYLVKRITIKGMPLLVNETFWAGGMAMLLQCYSVRGMYVVTGMNISSTITNLFNVVFIAMGEAVAIIVGQKLGAGKMKEAKDAAYKLIVFSVASCVAVSVVMLLIAPLFPQLYNTNEQSKELAKYFIIITAIFLPQQAFLNASYFTLRSGGKTIITFFFDSVFVCCVSVPIAYILGHFTDMYVVYIFIAVQLADIIKSVIGFVLVKKGVWLHNIVA